MCKMDPLRLPGFTLVTGHWPRGECVHQGNPQTLQSGLLFLDLTVKYLPPQLCFVLESLAVLVDNVMSTQWSQFPSKLIISLVCIFEKGSEEDLHWVLVDIS